MTGIQMSMPGGIDNGPVADPYAFNKMADNQAGPVQFGARMMTPEDQALQDQAQAYGLFLAQNPTAPGADNISFEDWKAQQGTALGSLPTTGPLSMSAKPGMMSLSLNGAAPV
jgi:hypothetical protein